MRTLARRGCGVRRAGVLALMGLPAIWLGVCCCAQAADVGGSLVATTDYVYRGLSRTDHGPALQADVHLRTERGWFAGLWGSVDDESPVFDYGPEINAYVGRAWTFAPNWSGSVHFARYFYPDNRSYGEYDYGELQVGLSFQDRVTLSLSQTSDVVRYSYASYTFGRGHERACEIALRQPVWRGISLVAGAGYYDLEDLFDDSYGAWSAGVQMGIRSLQLSVTRFAVDRTGRRMFRSQAADDRWAFTAAWRFE